MKKTDPIGIFDSGVGGTSIFAELHKLLPNEDTIYLADSKNAPYGNKSKQEIIDLCFKNTDFLLQQNCKIIVVACNTATTNAIKELRQRYKVPIIGIEPAIKPAALNSRKKVIGILATKGTLSSELFLETSDEFAKGIDVIEVIGTGLVEAIEKGEQNTAETKKHLQSLLEPMLTKGIDYLVLGCSHYPYLIPQLKEILPEEVFIIDSGEAVARQTKTVLKSLNLLSEKASKEPVFYTNTNINVLQMLLKTSTKKRFNNISYLDF
ncbi:glutamate racemase [Mesonia maritima]|uniref:Glutamate racemase n=1 Tax=Mesonia maritima TaxID=1793873 RepID=A0ABU1K6Q7_9FLAO|nr:glutamate racemase [Mesonia maritima]MDR6300197.1 glutamate racemase [Mesonia maritima]